jgi:hypothetical protein
MTSSAMYSKTRAPHIRAKLSPRSAPCGDKQRQAGEMDIVAAKRKAQAGETVVIAYIVYKSRAA